MFARKIRCFENVCSLYSLSAQKKPTLLAKGAAGAGVGLRQEAGNRSSPRGGSRGERGRQQTGFLGPLSGSCRGCGCPIPWPLEVRPVGGMRRWEGEAGHL